MQLHSDNRHSDCLTDDVAGSHSLSYLVCAAHSSQCAGYTVAVIIVIAIIIVVIFKI